MESHPRCLNCGRSLTESEICCYFCEMDLLEFDKKHKKESEKSHGKNFWKEIFVKKDKK